MRHILLTLTLALAACNTPSPAYRGIEATRITVGQSTFDIRVRDSHAQAIRINAEWAPNAASVAPRAATAIEQASGCQVARLRGDQAMLEADLKCGNSPIPPAPTPRRYECDVERVIKGFADLVCDPIP